MTDLNIPLLWKDKIDFTRVFDDNTTIKTSVRCSPETRILADRFRAHGGSYLIALMAGDKEAKLCAALKSNPPLVTDYEHPAEDSPGDYYVRNAHDPDIVRVAEITSDNGPALIEAVARLVRASVDRLDHFQ